MTDDNSPLFFQKFKCNSNKKNIIVILLKHCRVDGNQHDHIIIQCINKTSCARKQYDI